jgi:alkanesulfonate monooxygenase SsuD/methylene tetrahydromethanopterin reductase-like flavin-dependent oxidoreductase (luciferase family)
VTDTLLRAEESASFDGEYYQIVEAGMAPGSLQKPRPPFTLAAGGPQNMRFAARHADSWNQIPGSGLGDDPTLQAESCLETARQRNEQMDDFCSQVGRDPATLRRSILAGGGVTPDNPWRSVDAFRDFFSRYHEVGVNEFLFYYPSRLEQAEGHYERIARELIPELKREFGPDS